MICAFWSLFYVAGKTFENKSYAFYTIDAFYKISTSDIKHEQIDKITFYYSLVVIPRGCSGPGMF